MLALRCRYAWEGDVHRLASKYTRVTVPLYRPIGKSSTPSSFPHNTEPEPIGAASEGENVLTTPEFMFVSFHLIVEESICTIECVDNSVRSFTDNASLFMLASRSWTCEYHRPSIQMDQKAVVLFTIDPTCPFSARRCVRGTGKAPDRWFINKFAFQAL